MRTRSFDARWPSSIPRESMMIDLPGARFAREDIKPLIKFDFSPFYDGDIFYIEPFEHLPAPPFPCPPFTAGAFC